MNEIKVDLSTKQKVILFLNKVLMETKTFSEYQA